MQPIPITQCQVLHACTRGLAFVLSTHSQSFIPYKKRNHRQKACTCTGPHILMPAYNKCMGQTELPQLLVFNATQGKSHSYQSNACSKRATDCASCHLFFHILFHPLPFYLQQQLLCSHENKCCTFSQSHAKHLVTYPICPACPLLIRHPHQAIDRTGQPLYVLMMQLDFLVHLHPCTPIQQMHNKTNVVSDGQHNCTQASKLHLSFDNRHVGPMH